MEQSTERVEERMARIEGIDLHPGCNFCLMEC